MRNAITGRLVGQPVTVVGFFSRHHEGVFTHMGQRTHLHVLSDDGAAMGHVDEIAVPSGAALKLPGGL
jgi:acetolactate decarboxylase